MCVGGLGLGHERLESIQHRQEPRSAECALRSARFTSVPRADDQVDEGHEGAGAEGHARGGEGGGRAGGGHRPRPVGARPPVPGRSDRGRIGWQTEVQEDPSDRFGSEDGGEEAPETTAFAEEHVDVEDATAQLGPRVAMALVGGGLAGGGGRDGWWRMCAGRRGGSRLGHLRRLRDLLVRWRWHHAVPQRRCRREHPVVGDEVHARARHERGKAFDESERVEHHAPIGRKRPMGPRCEEPSRKARLNL